MGLILLGFVQEYTTMPNYYKYKLIRVNVDMSEKGLFDNPKVYFRVIGDRSASNTLHTLKYALQHITEEMDYLYGS